VNEGDGFEPVMPDEVTSNPALTRERVVSGNSYLGLAG
jgi:hypothetical protein